MKTREETIKYIAESNSLSVSEIATAELNFQRIADEVYERGATPTKHDFKELEKAFLLFISGFKSEEKVSFMVTQKDDYFFLKVSAAVLSQNAAFFLNDNKLYAGMKNRAFISENLASAFVLLENEYGTEFSRW